MAAPRAEVSRPSVRVPYERKVVRKNNRGGTANVARGPTGPPRSVIAPPAVSAPAERRPRSLSSAAARSADFFWPHGNSARASPSRSRPAGVACTLLGRVNPAAGEGGGRAGEDAEMPVPQSPLTRSPPAGSDQGRPRGRSHVAGRVRRALVVVQSEWEYAAGCTSGQTWPTRRRVRKFRGHSISRGWRNRAPRRKPNRGDSADGARGPIGPP